MTPQILKSFWPLITLLFLITSCNNKDNQRTSFKLKKKRRSELHIDPPKIKCTVTHGKNYTLRHSNEFSDKAHVNMLDHLHWQIANHKYSNGWYLHLKIKETSENCKYLLEALLANNVDLDTQRVMNTTQLYQFFKKKDILKERSIEELKPGDILFWETSKINLAIVSHLVGENKKDLFIADLYDGPVLFSRLEVKNNVMTARLLN